MSCDIVPDGALAIWSVRSGIYLPPAATSQLLSTTTATAIIQCQATPHNNSHHGQATASFRHQIRASSFTSRTIGQEAQDPERGRSVSLLCMRHGARSKHIPRLQPFERVRSPHQYVQDLLESLGYGAGRGGSLHDGWRGWQDIRCQVPTVFRNHEERQRPDRGDEAGPPAVRGG